MNHDRAPDAVPLPICPRCGYDLAGTASRWQDSCDLDGTCPECGLAFRWGDVIDPARSVPLWFFENIHRPIVPTALGTAVRMFTPGRFWARVKLSFPIRLPRLWSIIAMVFVVVHLMLAGASLLALSSSLGTLKRNIPGLTVPSPTTAYLKILVWPYESHAAEISYPARMGAVTQTLTASERSPAGARADLYAALAVIGVMPLAYLILAQTLRRTKVRRVHLLRIASYSCVLLIPMVFFQILSWSEWANFEPRWNMTSSLITSQLSDIRKHMPGPLVFFIIELAFVGYWWHAATVRYLRLPHALGVVAAMVAITGLAAMLLLTVTSGWRLFFPL